MFKKILLFLLISSPVFAQQWVNDTLIYGWWHGGKIDTTYLNMTQLSGGSGTVTTFSATGNNGISTSVANPTTTPALTLGITNLSIGDTSLSPNSVTTTKIANDAVVLGKIAPASANSKLLGSGSSGSGSSYTEITVGSGLTMSGTTLSTSSNGTIIETWVDTVTQHGQSAKDTTIGTPVLITATSEPATPQFWYIVKASDIPTDTIVNDYAAWVTIGGKNNDVSGRTINSRGCRGNITNTNLAGSAVNTAPAAGQFWAAVSGYSGKKISVGDTIGIKMWASAASVVDFRFATIYIIYREIGPKRVGDFYQFNYTTSPPTAGIDGAVYSGAVAGVAYQTFTQPLNNLVDSAIYPSNGAGNNFNVVSYPSLAQVTCGYGQYIAGGLGGAYFDANTIIPVNASAILGRFTGVTTQFGRVRTIRITRIR